MTRISLGVLWLLGNIWSSTANANDAISIEIHRSATTTSAPPRVVIHANVDVVNMDAKIGCGQASANHRGAVSAGSSVELPLRAPQGNWDCTGRIIFELHDGSTGEGPLNFDIHVLPSLEVSVVPATADLVEGHLELRVNRDVQSFTVEAYGLDGLVMESASHFMGAVPKGKTVAVDWVPKTHEVLRFHVRVEDGSGFWAEKDLYPWFFEVPHSDVVFATNESKVRKSEQHKLVEAWALIQETVSRYSAVAPVNLFIGGYTDTVGGKASNQKLSEARAQILASWFKDQGFTGEIWYQGFGEEGQALLTGDEVDEEANRRALYIVAADPPPRTRSTPKSAWKRLK